MMNFLHHDIYYHAIMGHMLLFDMFFDGNWFYRQTTAVISGSAWYVDIYISLNFTSS